jgi:hypothetical protein
MNVDIQNAAPWFQAMCAEGLEARNANELKNCCFLAVKHGLNASGADISGVDWDAIYAKINVKRPDDLKLTMTLEEYYIQMADDIIEWCGDSELLTAPKPELASEFKSADEIMQVTRGMCK